MVCVFNSSTSVKSDNMIYHRMLKQKKLAHIYWNVSGLFDEQSWSSSNPQMALKKLFNEGFAIVLIHMCII